MSANFSFENQSVFFPPIGNNVNISWASAPLPGLLRYWSGSFWIPALMRYWNGASWSGAPLKYWNGSSWISV